ncbi:MAG: hypothetical protein JWP81_2803 [Ferruginibacter sp.]|nr:hypothetical protein [Ferruginibacter sp.]
MKKPLLLIILFFVFFIGKSQTTVPTVRVLINGTEISYGLLNNAIHKGDVISFEALNSVDKKPLEIWAYTVRYFNVTQSSSQTERQIVVFSKGFTQKETARKNKINISINDLLTLHPFTKISVDLGKIYTTENNEIKEAPLHSSKRSFLFLLNE